MPVGSAAGEAPPALAVLAERYDPEVIDVPGGRGAVRLRVRGGADWDARVGGGRIRLSPAREALDPDAVIVADAATWRRVAEDVRGGMEAFNSGRLRMRGSLHLGVGFLAATSGSGEPGRLRFERVRTRAGQVSILVAGVGPETLLCLHGLGGTKASFLPTVAALAGRYRWWPWTCPGSATPTSRSARPTTRAGSPAPRSTPSTRSARSAPTSPATAWAGGSPSRRG